MELECRQQMDLEQQQQSDFTSNDWNIYQTHKKKKKDWHSQENTMTLPDHSPKDT